MEKKRRGLTNVLVRARPRRRRSRSSSTGVLQQQRLLNLALQNPLLLTLLLFNPLVSQKFAKKSKLLFRSDIQLSVETLFFFFFFFFFFLLENGTNKFVFYLRVFLILIEGVPNFFLQGKQIKKI